MELTAIKISELTNTSRANISKLTRTGKLIRNDNKKYDVENLINFEYLISHGITKSEIENYISSNFQEKPKIRKKSIEHPVKKEKKNDELEIVLPKSDQIKSGKNDKISEIDQSELTESDVSNITGLPEKMLKMNILQLVRKYGGPMQLKSWAEILNKLMAASERDQKIQERKLELIKKDFVVSRLFSYLEILHHQMFDIPESISDQIISFVMTKKNNSRTEIIELLKNEIGKIIKDTKILIDKELEKLKSKYENEIENE